MTAFVAPDLLPCFDSENRGTNNTQKPKQNQFDLDPPRGYWNPAITESIEQDEALHAPTATTGTAPFSWLSARSLELCTENLGSETGSDIALSDCDETPQPREMRNLGILHRNEERSDSPPKLTSFPPPLTTISGPRSLRVCRRTVDGSVIIEAAEAPIWNSCLQSERIDGRLRLRFFDGGEKEVDDGGETAEEDEITAFESGLEIFPSAIRRCKDGIHRNIGVCHNWKPSIWVATS